MARLEMGRHGSHPGIGERDASMRLFAAISVLTVLTALAPLPIEAQESVTAFVNVSVLPMDREHVLPGQTVVVQGDRIVAIGPVKQVAVPAAAVRIDGRGQFLMPGLADMHMHLPGVARMVGGFMRDISGRDPSPFLNDGVPEAERLLFLAAANGVTTARVMYGWPETVALARQAAAKELVSPRLYISSAAIRSPGGLLSVLDAPADATDFVAAAKAASYDLLKMYEVGGEAFDSVVAAARKAGLPMAGHVPSGAGGLVRAAAAGFASVEHLNGVPQYLTDSDSDQWPAVLDTAKVRTLGRTLSKAGVWICPTQVLAEINAVPYETLGAWPELRYLTDSTRHKWQTGANGNAPVGYGEPDAARIRDVRRTVIRELHGAGVGLLVGTDAESFFAVPGFAVHRELAALVAAGLTPYEALVAATRNPAAYFQTLDRAGTVAVGKQADLVLLQANPLADIRHTTQIAGVMLGGRWLARAALDARLTTIERSID